MAKIENSRYSIEEAFRDCFYIVPDYQREYVWTEKEVQQLLDDIDEQVDSAFDREYFIGMVLVAARQGEKNHYDVIDGQQRLTTLFLLLCALRHFFKGEAQHQTISNLVTTSFTAKDGKTRTSLRLDPLYEHASEVMHKIAECNGDAKVARIAIAAANITPFGSLENLLTAYATIFKYLQDNYSDREELGRYWGYLANNVVFIQISTDVSSALKIFETINERGIGLNPMDLLKNLLFTRVKAEEFGRLKTEWKKITAPLEKAKEKPLRFLRYFLMANYTIKSDRSDAIVREDEIYDWFTNKENAAASGYAQNPFEFVRRVVSNVESYLAYASGMGNDKAPNVAMSNLRRLCGASFSLHYVLLLAASNFPKPLFDHLVTQLESFLFFYIFTKTPTKDLERNFSTWADELREIGNADPADQAAKLDAFVAERFAKGMAAKEQELRDSLKRYSFGSMQDYRTRYLLEKFAQYVDMAYRGLRTPGLLTEYKGFEIEHILPDTPKPDLREAFGEQEGNPKYDDYKIKLGNLTLLEKPINIVASNSFFAQKKPEYVKCASYLTRSIVELVDVGKNSSVTRINSKLQAFEEWNAKSIDRRQDLLVDLAKEVWCVRDYEG
ncbi:MAG: DUF262 domain-containing protein [Rhizomicrobium sp.]